MCCENAFRIIVLAALLMGVVSCQEAEQKPAALAASEESIAAEPEPVVAPATAPEPEPVAAEVPSEVQAEQMGPEEEVIVSYGENR